VLLDVRERVGLLGREEVGDAETVPEPVGVAVSVRVRLLVRCSVRVAVGVGPDKDPEGLGDAVKVREWERDLLDEHDNVGDTETDAVTESVPVLDLEPVQDPLWEPVNVSVKELDADGLHDADGVTPTLMLPD